jgi:hypothetical protein
MARPQKGRTGDASLRASAHRLEPPWRDSWNAAEAVCFAGQAVTGLRRLRLASLNCDGGHCGRLPIRLMVAGPPSVKQDP